MSRDHVSWRLRDLSIMTLHYSLNNYWDSTNKKKLGVSIRPDKKYTWNLLDEHGNYPIITITSEYALSVTLVACLSSTSESYQDNMMVKLSNTAQIVRLQMQPMEPISLILDQISIHCGKGINKCLKSLKLVIGILDEENTLIGFCSSRPFEIVSARTMRNRRKKMEDKYSDTESEEFEDFNDEVTQNQEFMIEEITSCSEFINDFVKSMPDHPYNHVLSEVNDIEEGIFFTPPILIDPPVISNY